MPNLSMSVTIGGVQIQGVVVRDGNYHPGIGPATLLAGNLGTVTTKTDANTGVLTLATGHDITTGAIVDVYWQAGLRRGMTVGTVSVNVVPIDGGTGDDLPIAATPVVCDVQEPLDIDLTGDNVILAAFKSSRRASISIQQNAGTPIKELDLGFSDPASLTAVNPNAEMWAWANNLDVTNPFAAVAVGKVVISNGSSAGTNIIAGGFESDA